MAAAQVAAGIALIAADRRPGTRANAGPGDHLAVGLAQALALVPGVSRAGAALTAGRARGLSGPAAVRLSLEAGLPVTAGAAALKGLRIARAGVPPGQRTAMAAGAGAALLAAMAASGAPGRLGAAPSLVPLGAYRIALGAVSLAFARRR